MTTRGPSTALKVGLAVGAVGFVVVVIAMGVGVILLRRQAIANRDDGIVTVDAALAASSPVTASTGAFVINASDIFLFDSKEANVEASRIASKKDEKAFARHIFSHGRAVPRGTRVRIAEGGLLHVRVQGIEDGTLDGWTDREFLTAER